MDDDVVADLDVLHVLTDRPYDSARIAAADVKVLALALLLARLDDIDGDAHRGPHVVVVDARGHHVHEHVARTELGDGEGFFAKRVDRFAEALGADHLRQHARRNDAEVGHVTKRVQIGGGSRREARHDALVLPDRDDKDSVRASLTGRQGAMTSTANAFAK